MNTHLFGALVAAGPAVPLLAVAYVLRPQWGRIRPAPRSVGEVLSRLDAERETGVMPRTWYDPSRPPAWTVQTRALYAEVAS